MTVVPKKALGQHFLVDENILGVIERLAGPAREDVILEVGPGLGVLTRYLAERVAHVHAVEVDRTLQRYLAGLPRTTLHWGDALTLDLAAFEPTPTKLVANLPYAIATPLVVESLDRLPGIESWCVMVQREVADRFFAVPGTKAYGAVSVLVQLAARRTGFHPVSREVFGLARTSPRPSSLFAARQPGSRGERSRLSRGRSHTGARRSRTHSSSRASPPVRRLRRPSNRSGGTRWFVRRHWLRTIRRPGARAVMTTCGASAKINLALAVGPKREDGLHEVATILQRVDLWTASASSGRRR